MKSLYTIIEKKWLFNPAQEVHRYAALFLRKLPQTISVLCPYQASAAHQLSMIQFQLILGKVP